MYSPSPHTTTNLQTITFGFFPRAESGAVYARHPALVVDIVDGSFSLPESTVAWIVVRPRPSEAPLYCRLMNFPSHLRIGSIFFPLWLRSLFTCRLDCARCSVDKLRTIPCPWWRVRSALRPWSPGLRSPLCSPVVSPSALPIQFYHSHPWTWRAPHVRAEQRRNKWRNDACTWTSSGNIWRSFDWTWEPGCRFPLSPQSSLSALLFFLQGNRTDFLTKTLHAFSPWPECCLRRTPEPPCWNLSDSQSSTHAPNRSSAWILTCTCSHARCAQCLKTTRTILSFKMFRLHLQAKVRT